jgi:hypothetical protein
MKTPCLAALTAVAALSTVASAQQTRALNPVGSYSVATTSETGQPLNGKLTITAGERYGGTFTSPALPQPIKIERGHLAPARAGDCRHGQEGRRRVGRAAMDPFGD